MFTAATANELRIGTW